MSPSSTPLTPKFQDNAARTQEYVVVRDPGASSDEQVGSYIPSSSTGSLRSFVNRFYAVMAPAVVAASLFAPADPRLVARSRSVTETGLMHVDFEWLTDEWKYMPEYITEEQVEELRELLSLPVLTDLGFDSRGFAD